MGNDGSLKRRPCFVAAAIAFAVTLAVQLTIPRPAAIIDDGGITLRYAERIASGQGFNYGNVDPVNGASNPLYTFLLAGLLRVGVSPWNAVLALGSFTLSAAAGFAAWTFVRWYSVAAAVFAVTAIATNLFFAGNAVSGLESPLSILLAIALVHALHCRSQIWIGVCLGLLVANKADGGIAALVFAAIWTLRGRRFPFVAACVALVTAAPIAAVIWHSFGTLVPGAALTKIGVHENSGFDRSWVVDGITAHGGSAKLGLLALLSTSLFAVPRYRTLAFSVTWLWWAALIAAYSLIDLGDPYPWYLIPPLVLTIPLAAMLLQACLDLAHKLTGQTARPWIGTIAVTLLAAAAFAPSLLRMYEERPVPHNLHSHTLVDVARQVAGVWLRENTSTSELFATPFGLPAYEYGGPVYDTALLNNQRDAAQHRSASYEIREISAGVPPESLRGRDIVAVFRMAPDITGYALYASRDSEVWRNGLRFLPGTTPAGEMNFDHAKLKGASPEVLRRLDWWTELMQSDDPPVW